MTKQWTMGDMVTVPPGKGYFGETVPIENKAPPSTYAVAAVLEREPGSFVRLAGVTAIRAVFIIPGMWAASKLVDIKIEPPWKLVVLGLTASCTITMGMLLWYWLKMKGAPVEVPFLNGLINGKGK